eukprot:TRINITY_DN19060_c0_g1_i1.p1 TRINITY_DN19060_c0_g1~~TRINITY_DN19060_c0_g1_i1.p1  ORF type:complete len:600 (+),score=52.83 TRINITY_DN19060_c0_g1_i1:19-1818(+)
MTDKSCLVLSTALVVACLLLLVLSRVNLVQCLGSANAVQCLRQRPGPSLHNRTAQHPPPPPGFWQPSTSPVPSSNSTRHLNSTLHSVVEAPPTPPSPQNSSRTTEPAFSLSALRRLHVEACSAGGESPLPFNHTVHLPEEPFVTGRVNEFLIVAIDTATGKPRCSDGNVYEAEAEAPDVRAAVYIERVGTGLHVARFRVDHPATLLLSVRLVWDGPSYSEAFAFPQGGKAMDRVLWSRPITVATSDTSPTVLPSRVCTLARPKGQWVRLPTPSCSPPRCLGRDPTPLTPRTSPAHRWVYAPFDCYYRIFEVGKIWPCLAGRWVHFMGDSTIQEDYMTFIRAMLARPRSLPRWLAQFVLGTLKAKNSVALMRSFDGVLCTDNSGARLPTNTGQDWRRHVKGDANKCVRITMQWNAHWNPNQYGDMGLRTYQAKQFLQRADQLLDGPEPPDVVIAHSNIHDLVNKRQYRAEEHAAHLRVALDYLLRRTNRSRTKVIWRTTKGMCPGPNHDADWRQGVRVLRKTALRVLKEPAFSGKLDVMDVYDMHLPWLRPIFKPNFTHWCAQSCHWGVGWVDLTVQQMLDQIYGTQLCQITNPKFLLQS